MSMNLKKYFPMIRERKEVLEEIENNILLKEKYESWTSEEQNDFLDMCTGVRGLKLLYDGFFKEIMNPEYHPERLNDFLSQMLRQEVRIVKILPTDSTRIADENSLLIMDIVVQLEDGSIANVEMQKIGYLFPGQRSACYSADLLLRQYKRVRGRKKKAFHYFDIKNVYTIVLFEKSPKEFHRFPMESYHFFEQKSDTGLEMELLQKYLFIPLDIFVKNRQNINEIQRREAWLILFSDDDPNTIIEMIEKYPEFRGIYEEGYEICRNVEGVMDMFSKELYQMDKNTVQYMIDEMQDTIDKQENTISELKQGIKATISFMRKAEIPEEEIRKHLIDDYQLSPERAEELLNFNKA
ncbi:MAG: Rpn family recombination-promoting nuclease/putative transposase [Lachnospiraceae bacterium]|nr:Rpn family recombination-promoting nuclease/putative transposase [Lachnospiraceae bacterium]